MCVAGDGAVHALADRRSTFGTTKKSVALAPSSLARAHNRALVALDDGAVDRKSHSQPLAGSSRLVVVLGGVGPKGEGEDQGILTLQFAQLT
jgi:hypothetical protein